MASFVVVLPALPVTAITSPPQRIRAQEAMSRRAPIEEPTGRLDSVTAETIFQLFEQLITQGKTILMVTHDRSEAERSTRILELADGEFVSQTQPAQL